MKHVNQRIFEQLSRTLDQPGMRINKERFLEYLQYTEETAEDISYEQWLGVEEGTAKSGNPLDDLMSVMSGAAKIYNDFTRRK